jgi:hypothetical protein
MECENIPLLFENSNREEKMLLLLDLFRDSMWKVHQIILLLESSIMKNADIEKVELLQMIIDDTKNGSFKTSKNIEKLLT